MKLYPPLNPVLLLSISCLLIPFGAQAQLIFTAGNQVATQTQPNVNNLIDLNLADFANNLSGQALSPYTATSGQSITGNITRSNLTQGSLLTVSQMNSLIGAAQEASNLSGVINFSGGTGTVTGNSFTGTNVTGSQTFTSSITLANSNIVNRSFSSANSVGTGSNLNSAPINGSGFLNTNASTLTLSTPVDAFGFTQLQRDGTRSYTWSVRVTDGLSPITISLGGISTAGAAVSMTSGDANAINYSYDTFVGYQAPTGYKIDQVTFGGGFTNLDSFSYAVIPEPGTVALLGLALLGVMILRRRIA
jgi:hypothetical protein